MANTTYTFTYNITAPNWTGGNNLLPAIIRGTFTTTTVFTPTPPNAANYVSYGISSFYVTTGAAGANDDLIITTDPFNNLYSYITIDNNGFYHISRAYVNNLNNALSQVNSSGTSDRFDFFDDGNAMTITSFTSPVFDQFMLASYGPGGNNDANNNPALGGLILVAVAASNICFPANTPVTVDQGVIAIEKLDPSIHTINNKRIVAVTKTTSLKDYLVRLDKDSLGENLPSETTTISPEHKILYNGMLINAKYFIERFEHVYKVDYKGEFLYNVLMDDYSKMRVNNLTVETLHPDCDIAQRYNGNARSKKNSYIMKNMMNAVINNNNNNANNKRRR